MAVPRGDASFLSRVDAQERAPPRRPPGAGGHSSPWPDSSGTGRQGAELGAMKTSHPAAIAASAREIAPPESSGGAPVRSVTSGPADARVQCAPAMQSLIQRLRLI